MPFAQFRPRAVWALASIQSIVFAMQVTPARADAGAAELRDARDLFVLAEQDEDAGRWEDALAKLERVAHVKLTAGIRYHRALCEARLGHLATAMAGYEEAHDAAVVETAKDVLRLVGPAMDEMADRVPHLVIRVADEATTTILLDDAVLAVTRYGNAIALNPGSHALVWSFAGQAPSHATVNVSETSTVFFDVPAPPARPPSPGPTKPSRPSADEPLRPQAHGRRVAALAVAGGAVALAGLGVGAYLVAGAVHHQAVTDCGQLYDASPTACDGKKDTVRTWDWIAAGAWAGAVLATAGALVLWTDHGRPAEAAPGEARVVLGPARVSLSGSF